MSVITNKWNDGSGDSISIESPSFQGNQTVKISSPVQKGTSKRSMRFIGKCQKDPNKQVVLIVEQEASVYTYDLILSSDNTKIAAKGGTATITAVLKTYRNGNLVSTNTVTPVLSGSATGFSISGIKVTASNRTTVVGAERSIIVTGKFSNTFDSQTVSANIVIKQEANSKVFKELSNRYVSSNPYTGQNTVKANGGTVKVNTFAIYNYTSGSTSETDVSSECTFTNPSFGTWDSSKHIWTCPSAGTTIYEDARSASINVKWNDKSTTYYLYQEANSIDSYNYSSWNIVISANPTTIAASGGTSIITTSCTRTKTPVYTSGSTGTATSESATPTLALTTNPGGFTLSGNKLTAANNPIGAKTATVTASYSGATSKSVTITQSAGPDGIGYMQIQGNGVDHYIFQIGRTPNIRSNDVQTLSESSIEAGIQDSIEATGETKSESLFTKIKNFIVKFK